MSAVGRQTNQRAERGHDGVSPCIYTDARMGTLHGNGTASASLASATLPIRQLEEKHMKSLVRSALAAVAAGVALAGCATYDYGYAQPYNGYSYGYDYGYGNGPYAYDDGPYYYDYGPSGYVAPSIGFGFTYRDHDRDYGRNNNWRRDNQYRRGDNDQWRGDHSGSRSAAPWPSGPDDPWGGTNKPNDRTSQQ